jgi:hypothetical protein
MARSAARENLPNDSNRSLWQANIAGGAFRKQTQTASLFLAAVSPLEGLVNRRAFAAPTQTVIPTPGTRQSAG